MMGVCDSRPLSYMASVLPLLCRRCNVHADVYICMHLFICVVMRQCNIVPAHGLLSTISKSLALPGQAAGYPGAIHEVPSTILLALTDNIMD